MITPSAEVGIDSSEFVRRAEDRREVLECHVMFDWDRTAELAGRFALGFELHVTDLVEADDAGFHRRPTG